MPAAATGGGSSALCPTAGSNWVAVITPATKTVVTATPVGVPPLGVAISPDGKTAYVTNQGGNVSVINTATNTAGAPIPVGAVPGFPGICSNGNALLASGLTFKANTSGALACTLVSGAIGSAGP